MPVYQFDPTEPNHWGYMPLNFFSPHDRYATQGTGCELDQEFREMLKALYQAGIEVILDVVYNHTGEGNESGPTFSCANRTVREVAVGSLRYWAREMM